LSGRFDRLVVARMVGVALLFLLVSYIVGKPLVRWIVTWTDSVSPSPSAQLAVLIALGLAGSSITHSLGLEATLGVFVVGVLAGAHQKIRNDKARSLDLVVTSFLAPVYFGLAGLRFDVWSLFHWDALLITLAVVAIACFGKIAGVYIGAWAGGVSHWERLALGFGMNARGAVEIIVATVGYSMGLLSLQIYAIIVLMAVVTSLMAGPLMKWAVSHFETVTSETISA
jgi:Kef-type K+ transport system membrane component KefB